MARSLLLNGVSVILEEIQPQYFGHVIRWRNDKNLNCFLNQPEELTLERQQSWYENYLHDSTQGFMLMKDKQANVAFGTIGWTQLNLTEKICITGRLLVGDLEYRGSIPFIESPFLLGDYLYYGLGVKVMYIHVGVKNEKALRFNRKLGFVENKGQCKYPQELVVNGMQQIEFYRTVEQYENVKKTMMPVLQSLFQKYV